jgi:hypothetical protein
MEVSVQLHALTALSQGKLRIEQESGAGVGFVEKRKLLALARYRTQAAKPVALRLEGLRTNTKIFTQRYLV